MPGPLPNAQRRRRNAPTIPTTQLPARGRKGAAPKPPVGYDFDERAAAWWRWAWKTPQAAGWSLGDRYVVARRAQLEDDVAALEHVGLDDVEDLEEVRRLLGLLKALAGGKLAIVREARELDDRLGLTPKGLAALRWTIVDDEPAPAARPSEDGVVVVPERWRVGAG